MGGNDSVVEAGIEAAVIDGIIEVAINGFVKHPKTYCMDSSSNFLHAPKLAIHFIFNSLTCFSFLDAES